MRLRVAQEIVGWQKTGTTTLSDALELHDSFNKNTQILVLTDQRELLGDEDLAAFLAMGYQYMLAGENEIFLSRDKYGDTWDVWEENP